MNQLLDKLQAGGVAVGASGLNDGTTDFLAGAGFDFLIFDTQHSTMQLKELEQSIATTLRRNTTPVVRVGANSAEQICYALDQGAKGIVVPMVESGAEAHAMVQGCKYPPDGVRSNAGVRGNWGDYDDYRQYMDAVNEQVLVIPMVETVPGMDNLTEIVTTPGVNALLVGPSDLSVTLGMPLEYENPDYQQALQHIAATCRENDVAPGVYFVPPGIEPAELIDWGFQFFTMAWQGWAKAGISEGLSSIT